MDVNIDLSGRIAIVTGAAQGLGVSSAQCLAQDGATVYIADIQAELAAKTAGELAGAGLDVRHIVMDVTDRPGAGCRSAGDLPGLGLFVVRDRAQLRGGRRVHAGHALSRPASRRTRGPGGQAQSGDQFLGTLTADDGAPSAQHELGRVDGEHAAHLALILVHRHVPA